MESPEICPVIFKNLDVKKFQISGGRIDYLINSA